MADKNRRLRRILPRGDSRLTLTEKVKSREYSEASGRIILDFEYDLRGTSSELIARNFIADETPLTWTAGQINLQRMELKLSPIHVDEGTDTGHWLGTVRYAAGDFIPRELTDSSFTFDTTGGATHITQSKGNVNRQKIGGGLAVDQQDAIGVGTDRVEGVDIPSPTYSFTETHIFPGFSMNPTYKGIVFRLTGKINDAFFKGFERGECLFQGVQGSRRGIGDWELTYHFACSPNETNVRVGNNITFDEKMGWDYLWVKYNKIVEEHELLDVPSAAYIERVFDFGDFSTLVIGT